MPLRFNISGLTNEILHNLEIELDAALDAWKSEAYNKRGNSDVSFKAKFDTELKRKTKGFIAYLKANPAALADSYGTGSLMIESNPLFEDYFKKDKNWNKARTGKVIVGRPRGSYINIFGEQVSTWGSLEGINLETLAKMGVFDDSEDFDFELISPSKAIDIATDALLATYLPNAYKNAIKSTNFGEYLIETK